MKTKVFLFLFLASACMSLISADLFRPYEADKVELTADEKELFDLINSYRKSKSLPPVPLSAPLTYVAQTHAADLFTNRPDTGSCNLHSWSNKGNWTPVCYTPDHKEAQNMWNKPRQLTGYSGNGFEISTATSAPHITPSDALSSWKSSSGHNAVMINKDAWTKIRWTGMGVGMHNNYAVVWFSDGK